jgi:putative PEP-CTERM system histidine kinase
MDWIAIIAIVDAVLAIGLAVVALLREKRSVASFSFAAVMTIMAIEAVTHVFSFQGAGPELIARSQRWSLIAASVLPVSWLAFSLSYSRGNANEFFKRWRVALILCAAVPLFLTLFLGEDLLYALRVDRSSGDWLLSLGPSGVALHGILLIVSAVVLMNLERTFRTATGTMRWRIKYLILGCGVLLGARIFTCSQAVLYSGIKSSTLEIHTIARVVGLSLIAFSLVRGRLAQVDIYPSHAFLYRSLTATLAGAYLIGMGLLAKLAIVLGGSENLPLQALVALIALVGLAVLLMSDRLRQRLQHAVSRHLHRPLHDYRSLWTLFAERTASLVTREDLCREVARLTSETFNVLSLTIFLFDEQKQQLVFGASTSLSEDVANKILQTRGADIASISDANITADPVDLDTSKEPWVVSLKNLNPDHFHQSGRRVGVPLVACGRFLGLITLTDRVAGVDFSGEDFDLLKCVGAQTAASLLNLRLSESLLRSKELEAFQTMSTFFVHDLKNTALMLSLMLQNLPVHFANPEFREDSLRSIAKTVNRINDLISRLSLLREGLKIAPQDADLNALVTSCLMGLRNLPGVDLAENLEPLPKVRMDSDQIQKVLTNLVLNARDAVGESGQIRVATKKSNGWAVLQVSDNGCGISPEFLGQSLFRPFQTTKKKGIGIGMYQSKMIVEAHSGRIEVESELGKGTTFRVLLPIAS